MKIKGLFFGAVMAAALGACSGVSGNGDGTNGRKNAGYGNGQVVVEQSEGGGNDGGGAVMTEGDDEDMYGEDCPFKLRDTIFVCPPDDEHAALVDSFLLANGCIGESLAGRYNKRAVSNASCLMGYDTVLVYHRGVVLLEQFWFYEEGGEDVRVTRLYDTDGKIMEIRADSISDYGSEIFSGVFCYEDGRNVSRRAVFGKFYSKIEEAEALLYRVEYEKAGRDTVLRIDYWPERMTDVKWLVNGAAVDSVKHLAKDCDVRKKFWERIDSLGKKERGIDWGKLVRVREEGEEE